MLVHYKELFKEDFVVKYAVPAFNTQNLEITLGIVRAAVVKKAPVIVAVSQSTIKYSGLKTIEQIVATIADDPTVTVPVALHLDHTEDPKDIKRAIEAGFSSVMIDASKKPFEENVRMTRQVTEFAHKHGVWVQGELGKISGTEDWVSVSDVEELFTDPDEAEKFTELTDVDTLAISVGTMHGIVKFEKNINPDLDIDRIKKINQLLDIPIVLHGASKVDEGQLHEAIKAGVQVVNIDTELRLAFSGAVREVLNDNKVYDPRKILGPAADAVQKTAELKLDQMLTAGKAGSAEQTRNLSNN